jgi:hypothetical protein
MYGATRTSGISAHARTLDVQARLARRSVVQPDREPGKLERGREWVLLTLLSGNEALN